eukprot:CAMPEP_0119323220 /NCGR_PEP_ID=MMETSP1333-20130426/60325_1 /TAXON_ID=418940 /ORGANISM="Scyphosphaera apsteinii, Strain RCC1455" /LENGTH=128 /DNA_ID=CAMNT_0007330615 /DNA_START=18 /DNA_END=404 /DNA_ORIENTATION=-
MARGGRSRGPPKILILARRNDIMTCSVRYAEDLGFKADGVLDNASAKNMLEKEEYAAACFGTYFKNCEMFKEDVKEMKALLDQKGIIWGEQPFFGDVKAVMLELGLLEADTTNKKTGTRLVQQPMIAG